MVPVFNVEKKPPIRINTSKIAATLFIFPLDYDLSFYLQLQVMWLLDAIPVNVFIVGVSILVGVILFLILTQIPDEDEKESKKK